MFNLLLLLQLLLLFLQCDVVMGCLPSSLTCALNTRAPCYPSSPCRMETLQALPVEDTALPHLHEYHNATAACVVPSQQQQQQRQMNPQRRVRLRAKRWLHEASKRWRPEAQFVPGQYFVIR